MMTLVRGARRDDLLRRVNAVHARHGQVEDGDRWLILARHFHGGLAVVRLGDDLHVGLAFEQ